MRLLTWSSSPPSGPAKATRPPSRATATAALAAQPPPVTMNSDGRNLGAGRREILHAHDDVLHRDAGAQDLRSSLPAQRQSKPNSSSTQARMMWCAIATGGGVVRPCGWRRASMLRHLRAAEPARVFQFLRGRPRCRGSRPRHGSRSSATSETAMAAKRNRSRGRSGCRLPRASRAAPRPRSTSPGSMKPARHDHMVGRKRGDRPSRQRSPSIASMITTGSVRGKCSALQAAQSRRQPACTVCVGAPQFGQKRWRRCQFSTALASAIGGRCSRSTRPCTAIERRSVTIKSPRALSASAAAGCEADSRSGRRSFEQAKEYRLARRPSARASSSVNSGSLIGDAFLITIRSPPIT